MFVYVLGEVKEFKETETWGVPRGRTSSTQLMNFCRGWMKGTLWYKEMNHGKTELPIWFCLYSTWAVSYTPPRILMESIRSPDKVLILLMDS